MRYLLLSSFLVVGLSCNKSVYRDLEIGNEKAECLSKFIPNFESVLYNTQVNVVGKHISGLLLFKKISDNTIRVVFSGEIGVKYFDFEFSKKGFKVEYCMTQFNKKVVINQLRKVIGLMIMNDINFSEAKSMHSETEAYFKFQSGKEATYYITDFYCTHLLRIENAKNNTKKIILNLSDYKNGMADSVYIAHKLFEFNISLKQIDR